MHGRRRWELFLAVRFRPNGGATPPSGSASASSDVGRGFRFDMPVGGMLRDISAGRRKLPGFGPRPPQMALLFQPKLMLPELPSLVHETPYLLALDPGGEALRIAFVRYDDCLVARLLLAAPKPKPVVAKLSSFSLSALSRVASCAGASSAAAPVQGPSAIMPPADAMSMAQARKRRLRRPSFLRCMRHFLSRPRTTTLADDLHGCNKAHQYGQKWLSLQQRPS